MPQIELVYRGFIMQLIHYPKISAVNDILTRRFHNHPQTKITKWVVTEFIDGDHLALYADSKTKEFKMASRNKFVTPEMNYSCSKEIMTLYKDWVLQYSGLVDSPVIIYGKAVGGHYNGKLSKNVIKTVCEYTQYNELIVHDILVAKRGFLNLRIVEEVAERYYLKSAPILYQGDYSVCCCFPENQLSAVPFTSKEAVLFDNEMKGIVIRPINDLTSGKDRVIMKKLNRKYIGYQQKKQIEPELTETLVEIAAYIESEACRLRVLDIVVAAYGAFGYSEIKRVAGRYVTSALDKVNYIKYIMLDKAERHLVNKELNKIAEDKLRDIVRMGSAA